jgi:ADP-ribose pyrophosphatase
MKNAITLNTERVYTGAVISVRLDTILEGDVEYRREVVEHRGSAVIVTVFDDSTIALVRQYRHAAGEYLLELPAGSLEEGEDAETGAIRELEEEVGYSTAQIELIAEFYVSPGFLTEKMFVYLAEQLTATGQRLETDEIIEVERVSLDEAVRMVADGRIADAKTIISGREVVRHLS